MAFTYVPVVGTYVDSAGLPGRGTVTFTPTAVMRNGSSVSRGAVTYTLDGAGALPAAAKLAATDDPGTIPAGVTYQVVETIVPNAEGSYLASRVSATYPITVPRAATSIDLAVVATDVAPDEPELYQRLAQRGAPGGYAPLDAAARVPLANLPGSALPVSTATQAAIDAATLASRPDVDTTGAAVGQFVAATQVDGSGNPTGFGLLAPVGGVGTTTPEALGAVGDGTTDDTAAFNAFLAGGTAAVLVCDPSKAYRIDGQLNYTAAGAYRRITSHGGTQSELFKSADNPTGAVLDMRYAGAGAKIQAFQRGTLEIDHIALVDRGTSSSPFLMVTNCAPKIHDCVFMGNPAKNGNLCDQDAIILGGTDSTTTPGLPNGAFQGYTGFIRECSFHKIRRAVTWQNYGNSVSAIRNTINPTCGSPLAVDAPFVIDTGTPNAVDGLHFASGNTIADNLIEIGTGYAHGIILRNMASANYIEGNHFWDAHTPAQGGKYISEILCDQATGASGNRIFQTGGSFDQSVTGILNGGNNLVFSTKRFVTPPNWVLGLKGDLTGNHTLAYEAGTDGPVLTGYSGIGLRNMQSGGAGSLIAIRVINAATPNGGTTGNVGDICLTRNGGAGTTLWVKESGNATSTGWVGYGASTAVTPPFPSSGYYLHTNSPGAFGTSSTLGVGTLRLTPWWVPRALSVSAFLAQVGTVGEAGAKFRIGVYSDTGNSAPGALLLDAGQVAADVTGFQSVTAALTLTPGLYWIGGAVQAVTTTQPQLSTANQFYSPPVPIPASTGTTPDTLAGALMGVNMSGVTGALPTTFVSTGTTANVPRVTVRVA